MKQVREYIVLFINQLQYEHDFSKTLLMSLFSL